jgi:hypothetical protein
MLRALQQAGFARRSAETAFWHWPPYTLRHWRRATSSRSAPGSQIVYSTYGDKVRDQTRRSSCRLPKAPVADSRSWAAEPRAGPLRARRRPRRSTVATPTPPTATTASACSATRRPAARSTASATPTLSGRRSRKRRSPARCGRSTTAGTRRSRIPPPPGCRPPRCRRVPQAAPGGRLGRRQVGRHHPSQPPGGGRVPGVVQAHQHRRGRVGCCGGTSSATCCPWPTPSTSR